MAILTISREFGSGGREIGQAVAKILNYEYINKERLIGDIRIGQRVGRMGKKILMSTVQPYGKNMTGRSGDSEHCFKVIFWTMHSIIKS